VRDPRDGHPALRALFPGPVRNSGLPVRLVAQSRRRPRVARRCDVVVTYPGQGRRQMKTQYFAFAAAALVTACLGCQKDPNQNEFTYGTGSGGNAGTGTGAGGSGGGGTNPNGPIVGMALATFDLVNGAAPPTTGFALDN